MRRQVGRFDWQDTCSLCKNFIKDDITDWCCTLGIDEQPDFDFDLIVDGEVIYCTKFEEDENDG